MPGFSSLHLHHARCPQGWVWSRAAASCYKAFSQRRPWAEARRFCEAGGGHLAEPREAAMVYTALEAVSLQALSGQFWIGGQENAEGNGFVWAGDNSSVSLGNLDIWAPGFPTGLPVP